MNKSRRPPADLTPEKFFTEWLPAEMARLGGAGAGGSARPGMRVRVELSGEGGGRWDLVAAAGGLAVHPADDRASPLVVLSLTTADFRAMVLGEGGPASLTPAAASPTDLFFVDAASQGLLASLSGVFRFEVRGFEGRTWQLTAKIGTPARGERETVIATDAATYAAILARQTTAMEAYLAQKITLEGDLAKGMQVGLALMPKF
jgi:hypothetical protein